MNIYDERLEIIDVGSLRYPYRRRIGITMFSYEYRLIPINYNRYTLYEYRRSLS